MAGILVHTPLVAAACMFALAGWLLYLNFRSPVNRSFSLFLFLVGMTRLLNGILFLTLRPSPPAFVASLDRHYDLEALLGYFALAAPFALAYFLVAYFRPSRGPAWAWAGRGILALAAAAELAYLLDHGLLQSADAAGRIAPGPLFLLTNGAPLAYATVALVLAREAANGLMEPRKAAAFLVSTGLALNAAVEAGIYLAAVLLNGVAAARAQFTPSFVGLALAEHVLAIAAVLAVVGLHFAGASRAPAARRKVALAAALYPLAILCSLYLVLSPGLTGTAVALVTVWRILLPALVAYALVRHRLFAIDVKIKWTISRGTVAVVFLAVFFSASKVVENLLNERLGLLFGGVSAGLLLFALSPLERFGHRIAQAVLPNVKSRDDLAHAERVRLFQEQAALVWSDGSMGRRERRLLDNLRERLGLGFEEATRLEHAAALGAPGQNP